MIHGLIIDDDEDDRDILSIAVHEFVSRIKMGDGAKRSGSIGWPLQVHFPKPHLIFLD
jgi:hypothetical protein